MISLKVIAALSGAVNSCVGFDMIQAAIEKSNWWFLAGSVFPIYIAYQCFEVSVSPFLYDFVVDPLYRRLFPGPGIDLRERHPQDDLRLQPGEDHNERIQMQNGHMPENILQGLVAQAPLPAQPQQNIPDGQAQQNIPDAGQPLRHRRLQNLNLLLVPDIGDGFMEQPQPPDHLPNGRPHIMREN